MWWWAVPLTLFVRGTFAAFMGYVVIRELSHKTPFKSKFWNEFFLKIYSFIGWSDRIWFRPSHVRHHQVTVHREPHGDDQLEREASLAR